MAPDKLLLVIFCDGVFGGTTFFFDGVLEPSFVLATEGFGGGGGAAAAVVFLVVVVFAAGAFGAPRGAAGDLEDVAIPGGGATKEFGFWQLLVGVSGHLVGSNGFNRPVVSQV